MMKLIVEFETEKIAKHASILAILDERISKIEKEINEMLRP